MKSKLPIPIWFAQRYMKIYKEIGQITHGVSNLIYTELGQMHTSDVHLIDKISLNKLYTLASAPEETREDINHLHGKLQSMVRIWY